MTDMAAPKRGGRLWKHRDFMLLWAGESVSDFGTAVTVVVLPLIAVVYLHATPFEVGALAAAEWAPWLLIGLPAGVWVDRSRCRPILIWCDIARVGLMTSVPVAAALGALHIAQLFLVAFGVGLATVLFQVAYLSYLPALLGKDDLLEANSKLQGTESFTQIAGPSLGGLLTQVFRAPYALVADAISYAVSTVTLLSIKHREAPREPAPRDLRAEIAEGGRYVRHDPILRTLTIAPAVGNFFWTGATSIIVLFLVRSVHLQPGLVGVLFAATALGGVLGAVIAGWVGRAIGTSRALWLVSSIATPFGLLVPLTTKGAGLLYFLVGNWILGVGVLIYNVNISSFRQAYCPPAILGRVVASMRFVLFGTIPLGSLAGGALAGAVGPRDALWIMFGGYCLQIVVLVWSPLPGMRDLPAEPPASRNARLPDAVARVPHT